MNENSFILPLNQSRSFQENTKNIFFVRRYLCENFTSIHLASCWRSNVSLVVKAMVYARVAEDGYGEVRKWMAIRGFKGDVIHWLVKM